MERRLPRVRHRTVLAVFLCLYLVVTFGILPFHLDRIFEESGSIVEQPSRTERTTPHNPTPRDDPNPSNNDHRLAILIPFRDAPSDTRSQGIGRTQNLEDWISYMGTILTLPARILVVEQTQKSVFLTRDCSSMRATSTSETHPITLSCTMSIKFLPIKRTTIGTRANPRNSFSRRPAKRLRTARKPDEF